MQPQKTAFGRPDFYLETVQKLRRRAVLDANDSVLVVCGGTVDRDTLMAAGFREVTISNVDPDCHPSDYAPYRWSQQNAEELGFETGSFDVVIAHSGLHHCRSPHRALLEMYRVAGKKILVFEPRDGLLLRLGVKLGFGQEYELAAVVANKSKAGGVENSALPNYVYRWTEREVEKTINSNAPESRHHFEYFYALRPPHGALRLRKNKLQLTIVKMAEIGARVAKICPFLANNIAFLVSKPTLPRDLQPWLELSSDGIGLNTAALADDYIQPDEVAAARETSPVNRMVTRDR